MCSFSILRMESRRAHSEKEEWAGKLTKLLHLPHVTQFPFLLNLLSSHFILYFHFRMVSSHDSLLLSLKASVYLHLVKNYSGYH